ncbi:sulfurtransferase [Thioalkalivibrio sulfidiphilus]|uniref:sulfurtransferase n=1 Tax=Thioalkalivibrio sulfidiphilus TaxID=1033854 RepID=UPI000367B904|nr:sulfurtransferase [Thioalkalivibrio sulfidiphilus]
MTPRPTPLLIEPAELEHLLGTPGMCVVDLCKPETYAQAHVPGALHLDYGRIVASRDPVKGLLPDADTLAAVLGELGITPSTRVIAYDDEGGGKAARLIWTLAVYGHHHASLLNGGLHAWAQEGHPLDSRPVAPPAPTRNTWHYTGEDVAERAWILEHLDDPGLCLVDTRTAGEYQGSDMRAARGGHIPGAVHYEWTRAMDIHRNLRLRPADELREELAGLGITPDKEVVVYCQTHHRSAHTWLMLRHLGFERVRGYPGAWSDWGNAPDVPVETGTPR